MLLSHFLFSPSLFFWRWAGAWGRSDKAKVPGNEAEKMKAEERREAGKRAEGGAERWRRQVRGWRTARKPLEVVTEEHATPPRHSPALSHCVTEVLVMQDLSWFLAWAAKVQALV